MGVATASEGTAIDTAVRTKASWGVLAMLAAGQFIMVLDTTVMNTSIKQVVQDLDTTVVGLQTVITMYALVMASFMLLGGKVCERWGAKRTFVVGIITYGAGSLITAAAPNLVVLFLGWSVVEGLGAILVTPAVMSLVTSTYSGKQRAMCYGILGGVAGASIAVGPLIGGLATAFASWRYVFAAETLCVLALMSFLSLIPVTSGRESRIDVAGAALSALGLGTAVYGVLMSSQWGWIVARPPAPIAIFGLSPTFWLIVFGSLVLVAFFRLEAAIAASGREPLLDTTVFHVQQMRVGLAVQSGEALITQATFFILPLYLQMVLGLTALQTGVTIMPMCAVLFVSSLSAAALSSRFSPRKIILTGLATLLVGIVLLLAFLGPRLDLIGFGAGLAFLGAGLGFVESMVGNVIMTSVGREKSGQAGGLQGTSMNLGGSIGVALVGSIVIAMLASTFSSSVAVNPKIPLPVRQQVDVVATHYADFVSVKDVSAAATRAGIPAGQTAELVKEYSVAQLSALQTGFAVLAILALVAIVWFLKLPEEALAATQEAAARPQ